MEWKALRNGHCPQMTHLPSARALSQRKKCKRAPPDSWGSLLYFFGCTDGSFWDLCGAGPEKPWQKRAGRTLMVRSSEHSAGAAECCCFSHQVGHSFTFPCCSHTPNCLGTPSNSANAQEPLAHHDKQTLEHRSCNLLTSAALKRAVSENL